MVSNCTISRDNITINGNSIPPPPGKRCGRVTATIVNNRIYINGYEYVNGQWKRTLRAFLHYLF